MAIFDPLYGILRQPMSAREMWHMQRLWALVTIGTLLFQWGDIGWLYSADGMLPLSPDVLGLRVFPRVSLFHFITDPSIVLLLYIILLLALLVLVFDFFQKPALLMSMLLLHSFHLRNPLIIGGGDVLLFNIGFLLLIFTFFEGPLTKKRRDMPAWLHTLLLWQVVVIYLVSLWSKLLGTTWLSGTAVFIVFQNPHFARFATPELLMHTLSPLLSYSVMVWEFLWIFLLIPRWKYHYHLMAVLMVTGILFHLGILLFLRVGSFSIAMMVAYVGLYQSTCRQPLSPRSPLLPPRHD
jgi:hypothetical protein